MNLSKFLLKQKAMRRVVYALLPLVVLSVYFFGWRALAVLLVVNVAGFFSEYLFAKIYKKKVSEAVFVSNILFALSLPPTIPYWIAAVGIIFGIIFGKMVFGGFGKNIFNPAISGRAFIYVSFGVPLTSKWVESFSALPAGLVEWQADVITKATPLVNLAKGIDVPVLNLFLGNTSGSLGETSALFIIVGGLYLMFTKTANFRIVLSGIITFIVFNMLFLHIGTGKLIDPVSSLLSGSFLFGIMFMATDPVSASQSTNLGRWIYGGLIGVLTILIRTYSSWPAGITFAILIANMFAPILDYVMKEAKKRRKA